jgi:hypothetical protein
MTLWQRLPCPIYQHLHLFTPIIQYIRRCAPTDTYKTIICVLFTPTSGRRVEGYGGGEGGYEEAIVCVRFYQIVGVENDEVLRRGVRDRGEGGKGGKLDDRSVREV